MRNRRVSRGGSGLALLVREYRDNHKLRLDRLLAFYRNQNSLEDAINTAGLAMDYDCRKHSHQWRIPKGVLEDTKNILLRNRNRIARCRTFDGLIALVKGKTGGVSNFGELCVYDAALRIGSYIGVYPREVYLHAGTKKGCRALDLNWQGRTLATKQLPRTIQALRPWEIEDFLCIYKEQIRAMSHVKGQHD